MSLLTHSLLRGRLGAVAWICCVVASAPLTAAITVGSWKPTFKGIEFATGEADASEPRLQKVYAIRVDLRDPDIEFLTTPSDGHMPFDTVGATTGDFLLRHRLQVAINANFFSPCCTPGEKNLAGLAMSRGEVVSPPRVFGRGACMLLITKQNVASIVSAETPFEPTDYWTAVSGSDRILIGGVKQGVPDTKFYTFDHPRTAVGLTQDRRYLILIAIDGRQPGYSVGAPVTDVAEWLLRFGAYEGINLDGGGSSTMVRADGDGVAEVNRPTSEDKVAERVERSVGNNFGVYAKPLPAGSAAR